MISVIITAFKEAESVKKSIQRFKSQIGVEEPYEILVVAPDKETEDVCKSFEGVRYIKDPGVGKPTALNIVVKEAAGDIMVFTDGDVFPSYYVLRELMKPFKDPKVGAVSGRPISISPLNTQLGYWSHLLTDMAHQTRIDKENFVVTGYLYAIKKELFNFEVPKDCLSDDAYISYMVLNQNYKIVYSPCAHIMVKYPDTFSDWMKQKKRSAGGYTQINVQYKLDNKSRTFSQEASGIFKVLAYAKNIKELFWTGTLILARIYLWMAIVYERRILNKSFEKTWTRVESTK
jgi:cellulose synthase/poly-beta-1,6-N-acetylglucosamine synthase-like glycosyltransferase